MGKPRHRQEVINVVLAQLLQKRGIVAVPEGIQPQHQIPDVLVDYRGLRLAIEGEFDAGGGSLLPEDRAVWSARKRVEQAIAHLGVAVLYPERLRSVPFEDLADVLDDCTFRFALVTEASDLGHAQTHLLHTPDAVSFDTGTVDALVEALSRAYEQLTSDAVLERAAALIETTIETFCRATASQGAAVTRFATALGIREIEETNAGEAEREEAKSERAPASTLSPRQQNALRRIAALVMLNAMIFEEVLARTDARVKPLNHFLSTSDAAHELAEHWRYILTINYYPIYHIAHELLVGLTADAEVDVALRGLLKTARQVVGWRALLRHDLAGRIYHRLLTEAKYLGAFYTSIPSAVLLLKLALEPDDWQVSWDDPESVKGLSIADLACGTGTLLMAAADVVLDNHLRACAKNGSQPDSQQIQRHLVESVLCGIDVLPSAVHLTASTLVLRDPDVPINVTNLRSVQLGGDTAELGSLEFLESPDTTGASLFSSAEHITGKSPETGAETQLSGLRSSHLCVMNPPFTRSVGGNLLFGNLPGPERSRMQQRLKELVKRGEIQASITAGLGSLFVALAHQYVKDFGRLAFVLPRALLSGVAWDKTRQLVNQHYHLEWVIVSHEPHHWNFSENTDLSEVLFIARKRKDATADETVRIVNLWRQPRNSVEALSLARALQTQPFPDVLGQGVMEMVVGSVKAGEAFSVSWEWLRGRPWGLPNACAQTDLTRVLLRLVDGRLALPGLKALGLHQQMPLCPLGRIADLGMDRRNIHDVFGLAVGVTSYPAFWGHTTDEVVSVQSSPNRYLAPRAPTKQDRPRKLWASASCLLIAERIRLNTARVASIRVSEPVLANVWWTAQLHRAEADLEKALCLWLNSSLGLLIAYGHREETEGPWMGLKKATLKDTPVLNVADLTDCQVERLVRAFDDLGDQPLLALPQMDNDPTRRTIDDTISDVFGLPDLGILRQMLAREPVVCLSLDRLSP